MNKIDLLKKVGNMQQVAYVRQIEYCEGRASKLKAYEIKNDKMLFHVMVDKCLDISDLSYKGVNISFLSKPGLQGRNQYDTNGEEALRSIMGGFLFTAGLENICQPCTLDRKEYPMHGRIRTTPAEHISADAKWENDCFVMSVSGEMREAELFGENMTLRRRIESRLFGKSIIISDLIVNESFRDEPLMILYHFNIGYPFLDENTELLIPTKKVHARDVFSLGQEKNYNLMEKPRNQEIEKVFLHDLIKDAQHNTTVYAINEKLEIGLQLDFNMINLPYFMEWKSIASGDYVIGLEPANASVYGKKYHVEHNDVHTITSMQSEENVIKITILDGALEIKKARERHLEFIKKKTKN